MQQLPIVALIGQTNAGKSSLLNRFARQNIAIVAREAGTTRDNVVTTIDQQYHLIDTAGLKDPTDAFEQNIQYQIADAISTADLILLTLDSTKYPDQKDKSIAKTALKSRKPVFLLLNKADRGDSLPVTEFQHLGIKPEQTYYTSATTGQGIATLKSAIASTLYPSPSTSSAQHSTVFSAHPIATSSNQPTSTTTHIQRTGTTLALIGRPNVGKSSLFNSLAHKQQALVSSQQGTTRDVNHVTIKYKGQPITILDTAGLRKPGKREVGIEKFSALRTLAAIESADVCALLIDATEPHSKLDQTLAGQIVEAGKGIILVVTKTDLLNKTTSATDTILDNLQQDFNFIPYAPVLLTSSVSGKNVTQLFELTTTIQTARAHTIKTSELNKILQDAIISHPPAGLKNTHPRPKYIVQTDSNPPWFVIHGKEMELMHWSYKRYLERKVREHYPFIGTPIFFSFHNQK